MSVFPLRSTTLLLFARGSTEADQVGPVLEDAAEGGKAQGIIPGHGLPDNDLKTKVKTHFALAVEKKEDVEEWEKELKREGVKVLSTVEWPKGGKSVYFEDPDANVGEIVSRGIWPH
jgi:catechol 2,3-dioxygenase-like lactoylglutathione lyase family enzyme